FDAAEHLPGVAGDGRVEHRVIDAVGVHRLQALARVVRHLRHVGPALRVARAVGHERAGGRHPGQRQHAPVDHPTLTAVRLAFDLRYAIAPFVFRQPFGPDLGVFLYVVVDADEAATRSVRGHAVRFFDDGFFAAR